jgi:hypothetical protein
MKVDAPESQNGFDGLFSAGRFLLTLGLLIFISYPGLDLGTQAFCYRDTGLFSYPVAYYLRDSFWHGHWPLWNPCSIAGRPFWRSGTRWRFIPFRSFTFCSDAVVAELFLLGHLLLGGIRDVPAGASLVWKTVRRQRGGAGFWWNGLSIHCLMWPCHTAGLAWMPWVVWQCDRAAKEGGGRIYWAALAGACQMLTGSPEAILLTWVIVAGVFVHDVLQSGAVFGGGRRLLWVGVMVGALSAAQMLPWLDLLAHGDRTSATGNGLWSLPPWGLANFLCPCFIPPAR